MIFLIKIEEEEIKNVEEHLEKDIGPYFFPRIAASNFETSSLSESVCWPLGLNLGFKYAFRLFPLFFYSNLNGICITL